MPPRHHLYQVDDGTNWLSAATAPARHGRPRRAVLPAGVPQVDEDVVLAGRNDMELLRRTNNGRDINRHYYSTAEIDENLERPVVKALNALAKFRNELPGFHGEFSYEVDGGEHVDHLPLDRRLDGTSTAALTFEPGRGLGTDNTTPVASLAVMPPATTKPAICSPTRRLPISTNRRPINATPLCALQVVRPA